MAGRGCARMPGRDARLRDVDWRDLRLTPAQRATELATPFAFLSLALWLHWLAWNQHWAFVLPGLLASGYYFLWGLRNAHGMMHHGLGLPRRADHVLLSVHSLLFFCSAHAFRLTHLQHHGRFDTEDDLEGWGGRLRFHEALLVGPAFPLVLVVRGFRLSNGRGFALIILEKTAVTAIMMAPVVLEPMRFVWGHLLAMLVALGSFTIYAGWSVHRGTHQGTPGRTHQSRVVGWLTLSLLYHVEHHLFPNVPTWHMRTLAKRIDAVAPELRSLHVLGPTAPRPVPD